MYKYVLRESLNLIVNTIDALPEKYPGIDLTKFKDIIVEITKIGMCIDSTEDIETLSDISEDILKISEKMLYRVSELTGDDILRKKYEAEMVVTDPFQKQTVQ